MTDIFRALGRAIVSLFHPRMLWLAVWPFLVAFVAWVVIGLALNRLVTDRIAHVFANTFVGSTVDATFSMIGLSGGVDVVAWIVYWGSAFALMVLTALVIIATVAMPTVVDHVAGRSYPTLVRKRGGSYAGSLGNALWVTLVFLIGFVLTIPLWLVAPLAFIVPLLWWGWATARMFRYDVLVAHASAEERGALFARHGKAFFAIGTIVSLLNFVPLLFFVVPILGGLAFAHYGLAALEALRTERGEVGVVVGSAR